MSIARIVLAFTRDQSKALVCPEDSREGRLVLTENQRFGFHPVAFLAGE